MVLPLDLGQEFLCAPGVGFAGCCAGEEQDRGETLGKGVVDVVGEPGAFGVDSRFLLRPDEFVRERVRLGLGLKNAGEQALVFRNRRGYAPVLFCHDCGWSARCPECERAMTVHDAGRMLRCHHCGAQRPAPKACPECRGLALHAQGFGTERIESVLARRFPGVPLRRIDRDTTRGPRARSALLDDLPEAGARILIGTQMLAKGHDLPHLTLAVIAGVDEGLRSADFRAPERLGQLIVQVAGRAGRAEKPGEVLLQTHEPDHPLLGTLLREGYRAYTQRLLDERRAASLPPFTHFALLRAEATDEATLGDFLATSATPAAPGVTVHPPLPARPSP